MMQRRTPRRSQGTSSRPSRRTPARNRLTHAQAAQGATQHGEIFEENEGLVLIISDISDNEELALTVSLEENVLTQSSTMKDITQKWIRLIIILGLILIAAFAGAYYGTTWKLWATEVPQVPHDQPVGELQPVWKSVALQGEQAQDVQQLRKLVSLLAAEKSYVKKELQDMRTAMSAMPVEENIQTSAWVLRSAGVSLSLERLPRKYPWPCSMFWFLYDLNQLDTFVQSSISPGYCWPFQASRSQVDIWLPAQVRPSAITVQHPLQKSSALGDISSAPRDFTISGVDVEGEETLLGRFRFDVEKEPTQTFPLQNKLHRAFLFIRLVVQSNWGQSGYACIYRVQVHGRITGPLPSARHKETVCRQNKQ